LVEYHNAIVHKDEQIEKLTGSLQQSILNREEMKQHFKNEILQLQEQLEKTSNLLKEHNCLQKTNFDFDESCSKFEEMLSSPQAGVFGEVKMAFSNYIAEETRRLESEIGNLKVIVIHKEKCFFTVFVFQSIYEADKVEYEAEMARLKDLLTNSKPSSIEVLQLKEELDVKHSKEMEELRTYFEKKCADLEKKYKNN
jgi:hypothetical protein